MAIKATLSLKQGKLLVSFLPLEPRILIDLFKRCVLIGCQLSELII